MLYGKENGILKWYLMELDVIMVFYSVILFMEIDNLECFFAVRKNQFNQLIIWQ